MQELNLKLNPKETNNAPWSNSKPISDSVIGNQISSFDNNYDSSYHKVKNDDYNDFDSHSEESDYDEKNASKIHNFSKLKPLTKIINKNNLNMSEQDTNTKNQYKKIKMNYKDMKLNIDENKKS